MRRRTIEGKRVPVPRGLRAGTLHIGSQEIVVLSYSLADPPAPPGLTVAEREVLAGIVAGQSNAEIARRRRTAVRTVANQIRSIFVKVGVTSRAELLSVLFGMNVDEPEGGR